MKVESVTIVLSLAAKVTSVCKRARPKTRSQTAATSMPPLSSGGGLAAQDSATPYQAPLPPP